MAKTEARPAVEVVESLRPLLGGTSGSATYNGICRASLFVQTDLAEKMIDADRAAVAAAVAAAVRAAVVEEIAQELDRLGLARANEIRDLFNPDQ